MALPRQAPPMGHSRPQLISNMAKIRMKKKIIASSCVCNVILQKPIESILPQHIAPLSRTSASSNAHPSSRTAQRTRPTFCISCVKSSLHRGTLCLRCHIVEVSAAVGLIETCFVLSVGLSYLLWRRYT